MTGSGHRMTGLGAAFMAAAIARLADMPEIAAAAVAMMSTTIPDWSEVAIYKQGRRTGSLITHRTLTHWPPLWLGLIAWGLYDGTVFGSVAVGAGVGAMVHIFGDAPNPMGIPWLLPHKRIKFGAKGWWKSGEHEIKLILGFALAGFGLWYAAGGDRTVEEVRKYFS